MYMITPLRSRQSTVVVHMFGTWVIFRMHVKRPFKNCDLLNAKGRLKLRQKPYITHLSRFQIITSGRNVKTNNNKLRTNIEATTIKIKFVYEINMFSRFKQAALINHGRFPNVMLIRFCVLYLVLIF